MQQLCSEILIFKEKSNFWYTDHPEKSALILQSARVVHSGHGQTIQDLYLLGEKAREAQRPRQQGDFQYFQVSR